MAKKENKVTVREPRGAKNEENFTIVAVNGIKWKIKKGEAVDVPDYVAEVLRNRDRMRDVNAQFIESNLDKG